VTKRDQVRCAVAACNDSFGSLDILVACAGVTRDSLIHKMTDDDWDVVIDTHLKAAFLCAQEAQTAMVPNRCGSMVFLSSRSAGGNRGQANYSAAKAGIEGLVRTLAIELGAFGIRVNAVAPGFVETPMTMQIAERMSVSYDTVKEQASARAALGRIAQPSEIAAVVAFLASDDASFVTGQVINAKGGP
jgi:3-oxoacyl-[acyl-carrier protein] reductase